MDPINDKYRGKLWSPTLYQPGATRSKSNVIAVSMLVLDQDNGVGWEEAIEPFSAFKYLVHSSYNHTAEKPKYRIIIPLAHPVAGKDWPVVWNHLTKNAVDPDPACKDASRVYFLPSRPPDGEAFLYANQSAHCVFLAPDVERIKDRARRENARRREKPIPFSVTNRQRKKIQERQNNLSAQSRRAFAESIGATLTAGYATKIKCPNSANHAQGKNNDSVWFRLETHGDSSKSWAACNHKASCGWYGKIGDLE